MHRLLRMSPLRQRPLAGYSFGLLCFIVAFAVRYWAGPTMGNLPFVTFFLASLTTTVVAGWRPAVLVIALSFFASWYFFLHPYASFALPWPQGYIALAFFLAVSGTETAVLAFLHRALEQLAQERERVEKLLNHEKHLYHELQHRVANGIQSLASILSIQAATIADAEDAEMALTDAATRLRGVAAVHRQLHDPALATASFGSVLHGLARDMLDNAGLQAVRLDVSVTSPPPDQDSATTLAMVALEATSNAIKHAFAQRDTGQLTITLRREGALLALCVADDGPGPGPMRDGSLGMTIMEGFAERFGGRVSLTAQPQGGSLLRLEMPLRR
ncbi:sensor histidine kinase [Rhodovarius crocodyli]|nr:histidine kinase dimerization/phosphoacceptor domain -containing protein [Rhodovarius crocodyli]